MGELARAGVVTTMAAVVGAVVEAEMIGIITVVEEMMGIITVVEEVIGVLRANPLRKVRKSNLRCLQIRRNRQMPLCFSLDRTAQHFACSVTDEWQHRRCHWSRFLASFVQGN